MYYHVNDMYKELDKHMETFLVMLENNNFDSLENRVKSIAEHLNVLGPRDRSSLRLKKKKGCSRRVTSNPY